MYGSDICCRSWPASNLFPTLESSVQAGERREYPDLAIIREGLPLLAALTLALLLKHWSCLLERAANLLLLFQFQGVCLTAVCLGLILLILSLDSSCSVWEATILAAQVPPDGFHRKPEAVAHKFVQPFLSSSSSSFSSFSSSSFSYFLLILFQHPSTLQIHILLM